MSITYNKPSDVPSYVDVLINEDGVRFERDTESLTEPWNCGDEYGIAIEVVVADFSPLFPGCVRCDQVVADGLCCSSHEHELCHGCYRRTHFVEVCVEGCTDCVRESLPLVLTR
jgi:hypothetical protein